MAESRPRVLLVDDDARIRSLLCQLMQARGMLVTAAANGEEMFAKLRASHVDVVVLDIMLPGEDGFTLCRRLRATSDIAIVMLTAMNESTDRVAGLELGADDYVAKPFDPAELLARIRAVLRRRGPPGSVVSRRPVVYRFEGWTLDPRRRTLRSADDVLVDLTSGEFDLLLAFAEAPQQILSRDRLLDLTRGASASSFDRSIDVQVSRLRRKLEANPAEPQWIRTVRNEGYLFTPSVQAVRTDGPV